MSIQSYQIEKSDEEIRRTVLVNLISMLTERGILKRENIEKNTNTIINQKSDDMIYKIKPETDNFPQIVVKLYPTKITSINKTSSIYDFVTKHIDYHKIIIVKEMNENNIKNIKSSYSKTEIFMESFMMEDILKCEFICRYEIIPKDTDIYKKFWDDYMMKKKEMPRVFVDKDPMCLYYNLKLHDLVKVIRPSESTGRSPSYRLVV